MGSDATDVAALHEVAADIEENAAEERRAARGLRRLAAERQRFSWSEITAQGEPKRIIALLSVSIGRLRSDMRLIRRLVMGGLAEEGLTIRQIGRLFDVSHQRISAILGRRSVGD